VFQSVHVCVYLFVRGHVLNVCEHDVLQTACENCTKFTTYVHGGKYELIRFWDQKRHFGNFEGRGFVGHNLFVEGIPDDSVPLETI